MELESSAVFERRAWKVRARQRFLAPQLQLQHFLLRFPVITMSTLERVHVSEENVRNQLCCG
jgi:hypothetical protein